MAANVNQTFVHNGNAAAARTKRSRKKNQCERGVDNAWEVKQTLEGHAKKQQAKRENKKRNRNQPAAAQRNATQRSATNKQNQTKQKEREREK